MESNFDRVEYSFPTINGEEFGDCNIRSKGCSIANVGHGAMLGTTKQILEQSRANARRIAACINYCSNMTIEELEERKKNGQGKAVASGRWVNY